MYETKYQNSIFHTNSFQSWMTSESKRIELRILPFALKWRQIYIIVVVGGNAVLFC